jgi:hypothetical protein
MTMRRAILALTMSLAAVPGAAFAGETLTTRSLGKVSVGMTVAQAEAALGAPLAVETMDDEPDACGYARRADGGDSGVSYMLGGGAINRIDVDGTDPSHPPPDVITERGIGIGATEDEVQQAYPDAAVAPHPYTEGPGSHYFTVIAPDSDEGLVFETYDGKVNTFRGGLKGAIEFIEGCL